MHNKHTGLQDTVWTAGPGCDNHRHRMSARDAVTLTFSDVAKVSLRMLRSGIGGHIQRVPPLDDHQVIHRARTRRLVRPRLVNIVRILARRLLGKGIVAVGLQVCTWHAADISGV